MFAENMPNSNEIRMYESIDQAEAGVLHEIVTERLLFAGWPALRDDGTPCIKSQTFGESDLIAAGWKKVDIRPF